VFLNLLLMSGTVGAQSDAPTIEVIADAWRQRERETRSVRIFWTAELTFRKADILDPEIQKQLADADDYLVTVKDEELRIDGDRFDHRTSIQEGANYNMPLSLRDSFDESRSYRLATFHHDDPTGYVTREPHAFGVTSVGLRPALFAYRPLHDAMSRFNMSGSNLDPEPLVHEGQPYLILREPGSASRVAELWIQAESPFLPVRYIRKIDGRVRLDLTMFYSTESGRENALSAWEMTSFREDGSLDESTHATVTQFEFNPQIDQTEFTIDFPPGTLVIDKDAGTKARLPGGKHRVKPPEQRQADLRWLIWVNAIVLALLVLVMIIRRRSSKQTGQPASSEGGMK
jgi:hypothetical protein